MQESCPLKCQKLQNCQKFETLLSKIQKLLPEFLDILKLSFKGLLANMGEI